MLCGKYVGNIFYNQTIQLVKLVPRSHSLSFYMLYAHQIQLWPERERVVESNLQSRKQNVPERVLWSQYVGNYFYNQTVQLVQWVPRSHSLILFMLFTHQIQFWYERKQVVESNLRSEQQNVPLRVLWGQYFGINFYTQTVQLVKLVPWSHS